eukprot:scaffold4383_cov390-Prasinococcus_capsulatus_cf.AAC.3
MPAQPRAGRRPPSPDPSARPAPSPRSWRGAAPSAAPGELRAVGTSVWGPMALEAGDGDEGIPIGGLTMRGRGRPGCRRPTYASSRYWYR